MTTKNTMLDQKKALFLSASKFAVVGASTNDSKNGSKVLKWLVGHHKDVTPVNLNATEIQGIKCVKSLSELPDPTHTSVCIVVPPATTLEILQQAKTLGIFALWLQPGAEDDAVVKIIQGDAQLDARCVYRTHALHEHTIPSRTRSKPEPLSTSTNLPTLVEAATLHEDTSGPCLISEPLVAEDIPVKAVANVAVATKAVETTTIDQKKHRFLSAPKYAVVGASSNSSKNGFKALNWLVAQHKDVTPINLKADEIQGIKCVKALSDLPDPTHTSVSIVVPPKVTLDIVKQAKALGVFALWLQPGAEDDAVVEYIEADAQLKERCVYRTHAVEASASLFVNALAIGPIHTDTSGPCLFLEPSTISTTASPAVPLVASNLAAGVKHDLVSPPSTPPVAKSLKLAPEDNILKNGEPLAQPIPVTA
ncbi:CoA binding domain-containing protein [Mycena vulgaris]|nr:CoA binding domain-containing protein [Mycena vulgaris]